MPHSIGHASYLILHHAMCMWWLFTMLFVSFRVASPVSFGFVPELWGSVRLCSVCLLHGLVLLPCGISGKMTIPSKSLLSLLASCSLYSYATLPTTCYIMPPILPCQASNPPFLANGCLAMLPLLLGPSYSVASCGWRWSSFHVGTWILLGYHYYLLFTLMRLYTW